MSLLVPFPGRKVIWKGCVCILINMEELLMLFLHRNYKHALKQRDTPPPPTPPPLLPPLELNSYWLLLQLSSFLDSLGLLHDRQAKKIYTFEKSDSHVLCSLQTCHTWSFAQTVGPERPSIPESAQWLECLSWVWNQCKNSLVWHRLSVVIKQYEVLHWEGSMWVHHIRVSNGIVEPGNISLRMYGYITLEVCTESQSHGHQRGVSLAKFNIVSWG